MSPSEIENFNNKLTPPFVSTHRKNINLFLMLVGAYYVHVFIVNTNMTIRQQNFYCFHLMFSFTIYEKTSKKIY